MFPCLITELEAKTVKSFDNKEPNYYVRLGSLSTKLRKRAYSRAMVQIRDRKQRCMEFISELNSTVDLVGLLHTHTHTHANIMSKEQDSQEGTFCFLEGRL